MKILARVMLVCTVAAGMLAACETNLPDNERVVDFSTQRVPTRGWSAFDTLEFALPTVDSTQQLQLALGVRATSHYPYRNLQLRATVERLGPRIRRLKVQNGDTIACDTIQTVEHVRTDRSDFRLYTNDDQPVNNGMLLNDVCAAPYTLTLRAGERYRVRITHTMRSQNVKGLSQVYIRLTR